MRIYFTLIACLFLCYASHAGCTAGQSQVIVTVVPDSFPGETTWSLYDAITNTLIDTGAYNSDTICVSASQCLKFTIYDAFSDGLCCTSGAGYYTVKLNGTVVDSGAQFAASKYLFFNCPQGHDCGNPWVASKDTMLAPNPESWYTFTADSTGIYDIRTCELNNTCQPKLYVYDRCDQILIVNNNQGTIFYADSNCNNGQAQITGYMVTGHTYYIRIGQNANSCTADSIRWLIAFNGPVVGCMDTASCNFNPLATVSNGSCVYPPSSLCPSPDLEVVQSVIESSMRMDSVNVGPVNCFVGEGCLGGYGMRRIIRFTTFVKNIGNADYYIGAPDTTSGLFVYDNCHHHYHFSGYAQYLMFDKNNRQVQSGFKNGFCVEDSGCDSFNLSKYSCSNMGMSAGCGDVYDANLDCQWIDITDIDTGNYTLAVVVNWDHKPDKLGRYERTYKNNWGQVCVHVYYNAQGIKAFTQVTTCAPYIDCAGDTSGTAHLDCKGMCNGSTVSGDLNTDFTTDSTDLGLYLNGIINDTAIYTPCADLNGDGLINVTDAVRLSGCMLFNAGVYHTSSNYQNTHKHCEFPFNINNPYDTVIFSITGIDTLARYVDLSIYNPHSTVLAYEVKLHGVLVDSVRSLAASGYHPTVRAAANGHLVSIAEDGNALQQQSTPLTFLRVFYSSLTDTTVCIQQIVDVANGNYEQVRGIIGKACIDPLHTGIDDVVLMGADIAVMPNPGTGDFFVYSTRENLDGATIAVMDMTGREILIERHVSAPYTVGVNLTGRANGIYLLKLTIRGRTVLKRIVLQR